jgi:hypothetical protein
LLEAREDIGVRENTNGDTRGILEEVKLDKSLPKPQQKEQSETYQGLRLTQLKLDCLDKVGYIIKILQ